MVFRPQIDGVRKPPHNMKVAMKKKLIRIELRDNCKNSEFLKLNTKFRIITDDELNRI